MKKITLSLLFAAFTCVIVAQNSITYTFSAPITAEQGETITLDFDYVFVDNQNAPTYQGQVQIFSSTSSDIFGGTIEGIPGEVFPTLMETDAMGTSTSVQLTIPEDLTPTADLPDGTNYYLFGKIDDIAMDSPENGFDTGWAVSNVYPEIIITASTLSTNEFKAEGVSWFIKNNTLTINGQLSGKEMRVMDMSGRTILAAPITGSNNQISLSNLGHGVFLLATEKGVFKFAI